MPPQRPVTDLCINKTEVYIKLVYHFKISYKNKIKKMKTSNYEMYNWVAVYGKFCPHLN